MNFSISCLCDLSSEDSYHNYNSNHSGKNVHKIDVPIWNETVANLTLMALGSSAPEILISVLGTVSEATKEPPADPPDLGPATIVGSAAFNLLVITGLSIYAVGDEPKKIEKLSVFFLTSASSLFAYLWMYICLVSSSEDVVSMAEAWITFVFFWLLILCSYTMDKINQYFIDAKKT